MLVWVGSQASHIILWPWIVHKSLASDWNCQPLPHPPSLLGRLPSQPLALSETRIRKEEWNNTVTKREKSIRGEKRGHCVSVLSAADGFHTGHRLTWEHPGAMKTSLGTPSNFPSLFTSWWWGLVRAWTRRMVQRKRWVTGKGLKSAGPDRSVLTVQNL